MNAMNLALAPIEGASLKRLSGVPDPALIRSVD
jgi:hypothetical protein